MKEISIVLSGEAGKGIKTIEEAVTNVLATEGYSVYSFKEIMSRIRGGNNTTSRYWYISRYLFRQNRLFICIQSKSIRSFGR